MRPSFRQLFAVILVAVTALGTTPTVQAKPKKGAPTLDNSLKGGITAVDKEAGTITVAGKTLTIDSTTMITKDGRAAALADLAIGTQVTVTTFMQGDKLTAVTIKTGAIGVTSNSTSETPKKKKKKDQ